jgi:hypothetical protein
MRRSANCTKRSRPSGQSGNAISYQLSALRHQAEPLPMADGCYRVRNGRGAVSRAFFVGAESETAHKSIHGTGASHFQRDQRLR